MGTASTTKFILNNAGALAEQAALTTSAGAGDAQKLVALNASGILDSTIVIQPGEFIQTIYKNIGTVGTSGTVAHTITFGGYWE